MNISYRSESPRSRRQLGERGPLSNPSVIGGLSYYRHYGSKLTWMPHRKGDQLGFQRQDLG